MKSIRRQFGEKVRSDFDSDFDSDSYVKSTLETASGAFVKLVEQCSPDRNLRFVKFLQIVGLLAICLIFRL